MPRSFDGVSRYRLNKERIEEIRTWYDNDGKLIQPQKLLDAIWEKPVPKPRKPQAVDMLAEYKRKLLQENDS